MNTAHHSEPTVQLAQPNLKNLVARAFVAGGLGLAVMGLGAGMANAAPTPPTTPGQPGPVVSTTNGGLPQLAVVSTTNGGLPQLGDNNQDNNQMVQRQLQNEMDQQTRTGNIVTNIAKANEDTESQIIKNVR